MLWYISPLGRAAQVPENGGARQNAPGRSFHFYDTRAAQENQGKKAKGRLPLCNKSFKNRARRAKTPCAADGKCHDCKSPARICRALVVHMGAPKGFEKCEIVLVGESLGY